MAATPGKASIIWAQIPIGVRMSIGARDPVGDEAKGGLMFRVGPARPLRKVVVTLRNDEYDVKLVEVRGRLLDAVAVLAEAQGVQWDQLGPLLLAWESQHLVS